jgi:hypothetical protein
MPTDRDIAALLQRLLEAWQGTDRRLEQMELRLARLEKHDAAEAERARVSSELHSYLTVRERADHEALAQLRAEKEEGRGTVLRLLRDPLAERVAWLLLALLAGVGGARYSAQIPVATASTSNAPGAHDASPPH